MQLESLGPTGPRGKESDPSPPLLCIRRYLAPSQLSGALVDVHRSKIPSIGESCLNVGKEPYAGETGEA
jgi:hypothetical protein